MIDVSDISVPEKWRWFPESRFGLFIHWGPYAMYGRGEQVLGRENLDHREYANAACAWNPQYFDARAWADVAKRGGMKYAVLTTRHHDGFCLWDTDYTDYSSARQAARRDFVGEYVEAFREAGLKVGFYYSVADWRIPAYWEGPQQDPEGFGVFRQYVHDQVRELLTKYGHIDVMWFDKAERHSALEWRSPELVEMMRALQPHILINRRLGELPPEREGGEPVGLGDFGNSEHHITPHAGMLWESCQVSTWRLWGYAVGERWRPTDLLLDMLVEAASKAGNLLLNVGPDGEGRFPPEFLQRTEAIGRWLEVHGEAIYGSEGGDVCEFTPRGHQIIKGNTLYLVLRFWDRNDSLRLAGLRTRVKRAQLLATGQELKLEQGENELVVRGLPAEPPTPLFPVIKLECVDRPRPCPWVAGPYFGTRDHALAQARTRGTSVFADGES